MIELFFFLSVIARSEKWQCDGVHEIYDREVALNFENCLSNYIITLN